MIIIIIIIIIIILYVRKQLSYIANELEKVLQNTFKK